VDASPVITSPTSYTFDQSAAPDFTVTASAFPAATFSDSGNLDGLSIDPNSGILSGTPTAAGTFTSTITASNGISPNATQDFTLNVDASPVITSPTSYTFDQSAAPDFTVTASGYPAPTFSDTGGLDGLSIDPDSGVLSGTPTSTGTFTTTITATNGVSPDATQSFTLVVNTAPQFTSPNSYTFTTGTAPDFTVTAAGNPAPTFGDTGGLDGLSIDPESGVLSGTPTTTGTFSTTITATNGISPDATQTFTVNVDAPPAITSAPSYTLRQGGPAPDFTVTASGYPAPTYTDGSGSLDGLALNPTTGVLSGTPTTTGTFTSTITASNGAGSPATQAFTLEVVAIPVISSPSSYTFTTGSAPVFTVTASGYPAPTYTDGSGSLDGLALNATTGVLSGTPTATGTFTSTITAGNGIGTAATQEFTLTVLGFHITTPAVLPSVAPGDTDPVAFATAGSGAGATFKWKGSGFPKGLKLSAGGTLAGTVSTKVAKGAVYHPTVTVTETVITKNGKKKVKTPTTVSATFTLTIS